jgi:hypothetical protein
VRHADLVAAVVVAALGEVGVAALHGARRRRLLRVGLARPLRRRGRRRRRRRVRRRQRGRGRGHRRPRARRRAQLQVQRAAAAGGHDHRAQVPGREHLGVPVHGYRLTARRNGTRVCVAACLFSGSLLGVAEAEQPSRRSRGRGGAEVRQEGTSLAVVGAGDGWPAPNGGFWERVSAPLLRAQKQAAGDRQTDRQTDTSCVPRADGPERGGEYTSKQRRRGREKYSRMKIMCTRGRDPGGREGRRGREKSERREIWTCAVACPEISRPSDAARVRHAATRECWSVRGVRRDAETPWGFNTLDYEEATSNE